MLAGCASFATQERHLPPVDSVIQAPAPRPSVSAGMDLGLIAAGWRGTALENEARLEAGRCNYGAVSAAMAGMRAPPCATGLR